MMNVSRQEAPGTPARTQLVAYRSNTSRSRHVELSVVIGVQPFGSLETER